MKWVNFNTLKRKWRLVQCWGEDGVRGSDPIMEDLEQGMVSNDSVEKRGPEQSLMG